MKHENPSLTPDVLFYGDIKSLLKTVNYDGVMKTLEDTELKRKKQHAIKAAPSYRLIEILPKITVDKLRNMYQAFRQKPAAYKLKKQELIDALLQILTDEKELELFFMTLTDRQWAFFKDALNSKELKDHPGLINSADAALSQGYAFLFDHQGMFTYAISDEVRDVYKRVNGPVLHEYMEVKSMLNQIACAAVNLYGALSLEELAGIVNEQNDHQIDDILTAAHLGQALLGYSLYNNDYRIGHDYLASIYFTHDLNSSHLDLDEIGRLLQARKGKPRYSPDIKTFLAYADNCYYEETPHIRALNKALRAMGLSKDTAQELMNTLHHKITTGHELSEVLSTFEEFKVKQGIEQANAVLEMIRKVLNTTRMWRHYGHTPDELGSISGGGQPRAIHLGPSINKMFGDLERPFMSKPLIKDDFKDSFMSEIERMKTLVDSEATPDSQNKTVSSKKTGRNEPCSCGSGLKYKKCCGKKKERS